MVKYLAVQESECVQGPTGDVQGCAGEAGLLQINGVVVPQRRFLGAYHTPDDVAVLLAQYSKKGSDPFLLSAPG